MVPRVKGNEMTLPELEQLVKDQQLHIDKIECQLTEQREILNRIRVNFVHETGRVTKLNAEYQGHIHDEV